MGVVLQRSPALLLAAFGMPHTLEQLPQRAVQAALALRHLVAEGADHAPYPALRLVVHWGEVLVDGQASDPTAQLRALGETLAWPVRLLGHMAPGEILLSPEMGPLVEEWCEVQPREVTLHGGQPGPIRVYAVVGNRTPIGPARAAGAAAAQSVRRPGSGTRDAARAGTAGGGRPRAGGRRVR